MTPQSNPQPISTDTETIVPTHLGLILDGNRRWAKENGLPQMEGHRRGYEKVKKVAEEAFNRGVKYVSVYALSAENLNRSKEEVNYLMKLLYWVATHEVDELDGKNIKIIWMGEADGLVPKVVKAIKAAEVKTAKNTGGVLVLCVNYSGQQEIATAAAKMIQAGVKQEEVTLQKVADYLYAPEVPSCDLIVRTSGEQRLSNFQLWRANYAELLFIDEYWPGIDANEFLDTCLAHFTARARRFGK